MKDETSVQINPFEFLCLDDDIDDAILMNDNKVLLLNCRRGVVLGEKVKVTLNPDKFVASLVYGTICDYEQTGFGLDVVLRVLKPGDSV